VNLREYFRSEVLEIFPKHALQAIIAYLVNFILVNLSFNILLELVCIRGSNVDSKFPFINQGFYVFFRLCSQSRHLKGFEGKGKSFESGLGWRRFQVNLELRKNGCFLVL
jgi:hypothetical protein